jgi:hypothetical protein
MVKGHWFFDRIERRAGISFFIAVEDMTEKTLPKLIRQ